MSPRGARFLAKWGATAVALPTFSVDEEDACLFARDDDVEEENDERRVCVDIFNPLSLFLFNFSKEETERGFKVKARVLKGNKTILDFLKESKRALLLLFAQKERFYFYCLIFVSYCWGGEELDLNCREILTVDSGSVFVGSVVL